MIFSFASCSCSCISPPLSSSKTCLYDSRAPDLTSSLLSLTFLALLLAQKTDTFHFFNATVHRPIFSVRPVARPFVWHALTVA